MFRLSDQNRILRRPFRCCGGYSSDLIIRSEEQIGYLELLSRTVVDGLLQASIDRRRKAVRRVCTDRQYAPGDEIRQIDWQVFAPTISTSLSI